MTQSMTKPEKKDSLRRFVQCEVLFTPWGLLSRAGVIVVALVVVHLLGWRDETSVLAGALAGPGQNIYIHATMGLIYATLFFATVVVVPILVIASGVLWVLTRCFTSPNSPAKAVAQASDKE